MSEEGELKKSSKRFQFLGFVLLSIGAVLFMLSFYLPQLLNLAPDTSQAFSMGFIMGGFALMMGGMILMTLLGNRKLVIKRETFSIIKCGSSSACKELIMRDFKRDDFVFKDLNEFCPTCNQRYYIADVVHVALKKPPDPPKYDEFRIPKDKPRMEFESIVVSKCSNKKCEGTEIRPFKDSDYIFKQSERRCQRCDQPMYITEISDHILEKSKYLEENELRKEIIKSRSVKEPKVRRRSETILSCTNPKQCDFETRREYKEGDYVFKSEKGESCKVCGSALRISQIVETLIKTKYREKLMTFKSSSVKMKIEYKTQVQVHCVNTQCDVSLIRDFREGDYIYKIETEKCDHCGSELMVFRIFDEKLEIPEKTRLYPPSIPAEPSS